MTTSRSTPITRAHTLFDCTPFALALFPAFDSRKAKPGNGVHPRMLSYPPTERDEEPELLTLAVMQALLGFAHEARWLRHARVHLTHLFPYLPGQAGYNKRLRRSTVLLRAMIRLLAEDTDVWA